MFISHKEEIIAKTGIIYWLIMIIAVLIFIRLLGIMFIEKNKWHV